jgi:signal transduction histidine kinase
MFSKLTRNPLALRLTLWYAGIFAVSSMAAFGLLYALIVSVVRERTDEDLEEDMEEFATFMRNEGLDRVRSEIRTETSGSSGEDAGFQIWTNGGRILSAGLSGPDTAPGPTDDPVLFTLPGSSYRTRWIEGTLAPDYAIRIGQSLEDDDAFIANFRNGFLFTLGAVLLVGAPVGWFLARRALRPVEVLTRTAAEISEGALSRRVPVASANDELGLLARTFNTMLDRIQALIVAMREMTDNLAHDLRSPLARIRANSEMALANGESQSALIASTIEECDRLMDMIDTTLDIAEAESGAARLKLDEVNLSLLVLDACDMFKPAAEDHHIRLSAHVPDRCVLQADRHRLQRILANLIDNAIKYTPEDGSIDVRLREDDGRIQLEIKDTGAGISATDLPRIFQRFYRGDQSRTGNGTGLGLSLALAFARAHGGDIIARSAPGQGSTFTLVLPRPRTE